MANEQDGSGEIISPDTPVINPLFKVIFAYRM